MPIPDLSPKGINESVKKGVNSLNLNTPPVAAPTPAIIPPAKKPGYATSDFSSMVPSKVKIESKFGDNGLPLGTSGGMDFAGPQKEVTPPNKLVVTSGPAKRDFTQTTSDLTKILATLNGSPSVGGDKERPTVDNTNDSYTAMLDKLSSSSDEATKALISSIQAGRINQKNTLDSQYANYKSGLQLLGIQHNEAQATPDILMGHIQQAENEHQAKISQLDVETNKALMDANKAKTEGNLAILKEKMAYVKDLKKEKDDYLKNIADQMTAQKTIAEAQAGQYYDAMEKLNPADKEAFLVALAKKNNLPLGALVQAITVEKERREDRDLSVSDKKSIIASRNKATSEAATTAIKFGQPDVQALTLAGIPPAEIKSLETAINKFGIDKVLSNKNLNDAQRSAIKKVLGAQAGATDIKSLVKNVSTDVQDNLDDNGFITAAGLKPILSKITAAGGDVFEALKELSPYLRKNASRKNYGLPSVQLDYIKALK